MKLYHVPYKISLNHPYDYLYVYATTEYMATQFVLKFLKEKVSYNIDKIKMYMAIPIMEGECYERNKIINPDQKINFSKLLEAWNNLPGK